MKRQHGFTLIMAIALLSLVAGFGAVMTAPTLRESAQVKMHLARLRAEYLARAGLEHARHAPLAMTEQPPAEYDLGDGHVSVRFEMIETNMVRVISTGSVTPAWSRKPVTWTLERRIMAK